MRAFVFPGQGSQKVGMGKELAEASAVAREVFEEVDEALAQKLSTLMFEGPDDQLTLTENAQPAIMANAIATLRVLEKEGVQEIDVADKPFDHNTMQALMQEKKEGVESGMVIEVLQKGYMLKDRILRPALVKVSE